jgi:hypothetical protein
MYISMICILLYATSTTVEIMQFVGVVSRFQYTPKEKNIKEVKRIFRNLKNTLHFGLWYPKGEDLTLTTYTNADWA